MELSAILISLGINIVITLSLFLLYSVLRKQPTNRAVYYARRIAMHKCSGHSRSSPFTFDRFVPSTSWIVKAWETTDEEILAVGGVDAVVFVRIIVFSIRIFCIAAIMCTFLVLPLNYYGQEMVHRDISSVALEVFTIANVQESSRWLWAHCLALYVISFSACVLLYFEYKSIAKMRLTYITESPPNPSHFTVLVRAIPRASEQSYSYSDSVKTFFMKYYASSYLTHQIVYRSGTVQKLMNDAEKMYRVLKHVASEGNCKPSFIPCCLCTTNPNSFKILSSDSAKESSIQFDDDDLATRQKECSAAFVSFKTRHAATVIAEVLQSSNPMLWVTELAPEPHDILWSNLCIPYRQLWIRKLVTLLVFILLTAVFMFPVSLVQGLAKIDKLVHAFPPLKGFLRLKFIHDVATGYLPSVVLMIFLYMVPPAMTLLSKVDGSISRSGRKRSICIKVLCCTFWNVFFATVLTGSFVDQLAAAFTSVKDISREIAEAVPKQASFFTAFVLTSGWASLSAEIMQPFALFCIFIRKFVLRKGDPLSVTQSFPYHTEVPKLLVFGGLGIICSILIPLIVPFLLIYFLLAYLVYRNQIINVYVTEYETGGQLWPIAHTMTIIALLIAQAIDLMVFLIKKSIIAAGFTLPLIIGTLLFNEYCRRRFLPTFEKVAAQVLMEMDEQDEQTGRMEEIHQQLGSAYCQFWLSSNDISCEGEDISHREDGDHILQDPEV